MLRQVLTESELGILGLTTTSDTSPPPTPLPLKEFYRIRWYLLFETSAFWVCTFGLLWRFVSSGQRYPQLEIYWWIVFFVVLSQIIETYLAGCLTHLRFECWGLFGLFVGVFGTTTTILDVLFVAYSRNVDTALFAVGIGVLGFGRIIYSSIWKLRTFLSLYSKRDVYTPERIDKIFKIYALTRLVDDLRNMCSRCRWCLRKPKLRDRRLHRSTVGVGRSGNATEMTDLGSIIHEREESNNASTTSPQSNISDEITDDISCHNHDLLTSANNTTVKIYSIRYSFIILCLNFRLYAIRTLDVFNHISFSVPFWSNLHTIFTFGTSVNTTEQTANGITCRSEDGVTKNSALSGDGGGQVPLRNCDSYSALIEGSILPPPPVSTTTSTYECVANGDYIRQQQSSHVIIEKMDTPNVKILQLANALSNANLLYIESVIQQKYLRSDLVEAHEFNSALSSIGRCFGVDLLLMVLKIYILIRGGINIFMTIVIIIPFLRTISLCVYNTADQAILEDMFTTD